MAEVDSGDGELVERIAGGGVSGRAAEAELCRRFAPRIRLYGLRHLRDDDRARDLVQAVLLAVLEAARARRIAEPDKLERFVLGTCRNTASRVRESARRLAPLTHEPVVPPRDDDVGRVDLAALARCVDQLEERAKSVVRMSFQEERSSSEIAAALSLTTGNVRVVRHRAVLALRRCLDTRAEVPS